MSAAFRRAIAIEYERTSLMAGRDSERLDYLEHETEDLLKEMTWHEKSLMYRIRAALEVASKERGGYFEPKVYFAQSESASVKIGFTVGPIKQRLSALQNGNHEKIEVRAIIYGPQSIETALHKEFKADRMKGEWFRQSPSLERIIKQHPHLEGPPDPPCTCRWCSPVPSQCEF